jgi:hypothetical protein
MRHLAAGALLASLSFATAHAETRAQGRAMQEMLNSIPARGTWWLVNTMTARCKPTDITPRGLVRWAVARGEDVGAKGLPNVPLGRAEVAEIGEPATDYLFVQPFGMCQVMLKLQQREGVIPGR